MSVQRDLRLFNLFNFLINLNFFSAILVLYFAHVTSSFAQAGIVLAVIPLSTAIMEVPTGIYSDVIGRKNAIVLGTIFALISVVFYGFGLNLWILCIGAFFHGGARAFFNGNNDAYLHNLLGLENLESDYHHHRGKLETSFMVGTSIGALLSGLIASYSYSLTVWLSFIPQFMALIVVLMMTQVPKVEQKSFTIWSHLKEAFYEVKNNYNLRLLSLSTIFGDSFGRTASDFQSAVFSVFWPLWAVGFAKALIEWIAIPGTYFSGKIIDKLGPFKVMLISNLYASFSNLIAVLIPTKLSPAIISTSAVLWGPGEVANVTLLQKEFTERQRATIASLNSFIGSIIYAVFAYFIGTIADHFGAVRAMLIIEIFILPSLFLNWKLFQKNK